MNIRHVGSYALGTFGTAILEFITIPILTWYYSVEDIGRFSMLQVAVNFIILLFSLGLDQCFIREYFECDNNKKLFKISFLPGFVSLLFFLIIVLFCCNLLSNFLFEIDNFKLSFLTALCFIMAYSTRFLSLILRVESKGFYYSLGQVLPRVAFLLIVFVFLLSGYPFNFYYLLFARTLSLTLGSVGLLISTKEVWLNAIFEPVVLKDYKKPLKMGIPLIFAGLAFWAVIAMDRLFLRTLSTFNELAIYSVSVNFSSVAIIFQNIFCVIWAPMFYKWLEKDENLARRKVIKAIDSIFIIVCLIYCAMGMFSWLFAYILPPEYKHVPYILISCLSSPLLYTLSEATGVGIGVSRKTAYVLLASLVAAVINFIGNYLLVGKYGAAGAAISTSLAFWFFFVLKTEFSIFLWKSFPRFKMYITTMFLTILSAISSLGTSHSSFWLTMVWCFALVVIIAFNFSRIGNFLSSFYRIATQQFANL